MTTNTSFTWGVAYAGSTFDLRSAGNEMAVVCPPYTGAAAAQLRGFSLAAGDTLDVQPILQTANVPVTAAELGAYFSTTENNGSTLLWFNAAGTGAVPGDGATVVAVLENTQLSMSQLVSAMNVGAPITPTAVQSLMHMGCTNNVITYRLEGLETVCLQSPSQGVQQLAGFNAAMGDVIGLDDVLDTTPVQGGLAGVGAYITSTVSAAGTTLYFDPTGQGLQGSAIAVLQGVDTTVAQLIADGGLQYSGAPTPNDLTYSSTASGFNNFIDLYNFEASYPDLINAFGFNQRAMQSWYNTYEPTEKRIETFDGLDYVASYPGLISAYASAGSLQATQDDGAKSFIAYGFTHGLATTFNGLDYIASYGDLINAYGASNDLGAYHYIEYGHNEGRTVTFDGLDYIASYSDLIKAYGANEQAGAVHFIDYGFKEGRATTFDGLSYIADYTDLMSALGADNNGGATHYITYGFNEGRSNEFTFHDAMGTFFAAAAVTEYEKDFPTTAHFGNNDDDFFTAYIDAYKWTGHYLGQT